MSTSGRTIRLVTPIMRSQTSLLQPRYTTLINPAFSTLHSTHLSPLSRTFTSRTLPRLASPAGASHASSASHDSHGHHSGAGEDRSAPGYGLHFHEPSRWHVLGSKVFGGLLWFWLLYRLKNDWRYLFFWDNPFDAHESGAAHDEHKTEHH